MPRRLRARDLLLPETCVVLRTAWRGGVDFFQCFFFVLFYDADRSYGVPAWFCAWVKVGGNRFSTAECCFLTVWKFILFFFSLFSYPYQQNDIKKIKNLLCVCFSKRCRSVLIGRLLCGGWRGNVLFQVDSGRLLVGRRYHDHGWIRRHEVHTAKHKHNNNYTEETSTFPYLFK